MKYLFIDCDGCLNNSFYCKYHEDDYVRLDPKNLQIFADFIHENPEVRIVLSSDWRYDFESDLTPASDYYEVPIISHGQIKEIQVPSRAVVLLNAFKEYNLKLFDKTGYPERTTRYDYIWDRPDVIERYIEEHLTEDDLFVVVDDNDEGLSERFPNNYVRTKYTEGLRPKDIDKIKEILKIK